MDDFDLKRLEAIGRAARRAKIKVNDLLVLVERWNTDHEFQGRLNPAPSLNRKVIDAMMDLSNTCAARERANRE